MEERGRGSREQSSPKRGGTVATREAMKKVQVVYYLTHNGQLEHPHFMEVYHLTSHPLRLKDFIGKLIVLRGRGMPYQYSWSCRRNYKNGYVWNDITENDIIHPSQGTEYILKGSEIVHYPCTAEEERCPQTYGNTKTKLSPMHANAKQMPTPVRIKDLRLQARESDYSVVAEEEEDECYQEKASHTSSNAPHCPCTRALNGSTRNPSSKQVGQQQHEDDHHSPNSAISGEKNDKRIKLPSLELTPRGSSILFQLIACRGGLVASKGKSIPSCLLNRGEKEKVISCMNESPSLVSFKSEEKDYFSGNIAKRQGIDDVSKLALNNSSSYNQASRIQVGNICKDTARSSITVFDEAGEEREDGEGQRSENGDRRTCIPNLRRRHQKN